MTVPGSFVAVDWGTSSFRAWRVAPGGGVTAETRSGEGMSQVPPGGFAAVLAARLADLGLAPAAPGEAPLPVVLCGMVGARQGWREAGYLDVPMPLAAVADAAIRVPSEGIDARILPGLARRGADRPDVLRGEETQLLGLVLADPAASGIVCMPGTHSKWVTLEAGAATDFATVMTGELFAVLSGASILRHAIGEAAASGDPDSPDFRAGLADGLGDPAGVVQRLFSIRARGLLSGVDGTAAADRLSGLLIGGEVGDRLARLPAAAPVHLVASGRLARLYGAAFAMVGRPALPVDADDAVRAGLLYAARRLWPAGTGAAT